MAIAWKLGRGALVLFSATGASVFSCGTPPKPPSSPLDDTTFAVIDTTVIPMDTERELPHHTVLVREGRIVEVGPTASVQVPPSARRIDGRDRFLLPGLADMHAHLTRDALDLYVASGVTTVRNMAGRRKHLAWRDRIARGELRGPTIVTAGPVIDGSPPDYRGQAVATSREQAEAEVAKQTHAGYDFIKVLQVLGPEPYDAVLARAHAQGLRVAGHVPTGVPLAHALDLRQDSIEHWTGYFQAIQRADSPYATFGTKLDARARMRLGDFVDDAKIADIARRTRDAGVFNCPTLVVSSNDLVPASSRPHAADVAKYVSPGVRATWDPTKNAWTSSLREEDWDAARRKHAVRLRLVRALHQAGAPLLAGTDVPPFDVPGLSLVDELRAFESAGLRPFEALVTSTRDAQRFLRRSDAGMIAPGFVADLLLVGADPLRDLSNLERVDGVALHGAWLDAAAIAAIKSGVATKIARRAPRLSSDPEIAGRTTTARLRFEIDVNGTEVGEERIAIATDPAGAISLAARQSIDEPLGAPDVSVEADLAKSGEPVRVRIERRGDEEAGFLDARAIDGRLHVEGRLAGEGAVRSERPIAAGTLLLPPTDVAYVVLARRGAAIAIGERAQVSAFLFSIDGSPDDLELSLPIEAAVDIVRKDARAFAIDVAAPNGVYHVDLNVDAAGLPERVVIDREELEEERTARAHFGTTYEMPFPSVTSIK